MIGFRLQSKQLDDLRKKAQTIFVGDDVVKAGAIGASELTKNHLFDRDQVGNKLGGKRTHFYSDAAKSVSDPQAVGSKATFTITKLGLAQRWLGGTIKAGSGTSSFSGGPTKYLAIPARSETYGQPPSAFSDLRFVPRKSGGAMLVQALQTRVAYGKKGPRSAGLRGGLVMYWLVESVTQEPDPTVLPTQQELLDTAVDSGSQYLSRRLAS